MLTITETQVYGWEAAIRGMRNPLESWAKSDTTEERVGENDLGLMKRLREAGTDHRKFMRMLMVTCDINAPLYWWKEFDTYKVGTVANSCSTMHTLHKRPLALIDFSCENLENRSLERLYETIDEINFWRDIYVNGGDVRENNTIKHYDPKDKNVWYQMIQLLPSSFNQTRTILLNYEVLANIYKSRKNHKLYEWHAFCNWIEGLPYAEIITGESLSTNTNFYDHAHTCDLLINVAQKCKK